MDTRIVFATSHDGVRIAASVIGSGFPLLILQSPLMSHARLDATRGPGQEFSERLARTRSVIGIDLRGTGLSDRHATRHTFDDYIADIEAIYARLGIDRADVLAIGQRTAVAVRFAVQRPELVRRLILFGPAAGPTAASGRPVLEQGAREYLANWDVFVGMVASRQGVPPAEVAEAAALMHQCSDQASARAALEALDTDVSGDPPLIRCPTLVIGVDNTTLSSPGHIEAFVSQVPQAQLVFVPNLPNYGYRQHMADAIEQFDAEQDAGESRRHGASDGLTKREREVLALVAAGKTDAQIAAALTIQPATASRHVHNILEKLGMSRRSEAAAWWAQQSREVL